MVVFLVQLAIGHCNLSTLPFESLSVGLPTTYNSCTTHLPHSNRTCIVLKNVWTQTPSVCGATLAWPTCFFPQSIYITSKIVSYAKYYLKKEWQMAKK